MKPAIDSSKHTDSHGSSSSRPSQADYGLATLRKELKRDRKRERDKVRLIDGWEQYRTLWDGIEFKRQLINMLVAGSGVVRSSTGMFNALISLR